MQTIIVGRGRSKATQRMDINDPTVSREHCWLTDNGDGTYTLENKSPQGTFVNGRKIVRTRVTPDTCVTLGESTTVRVADLLPLPRMATSPGQSASAARPPVPEYSIRHLRDVWEEYHDRMLDIPKRQRNINLMRSASPVFTMGSGTLATLSKTMEWGNSVFSLTIILTIIGFGLMAYSFVKAFNDHSIEDREEATEAFQKKYVCPNPKCHCFMGNKPYSQLRQLSCCPSCKCKFTDR